MSEHFSNNVNQPERESMQDWSERVLINLSNAILNTHQNDRAKALSIIRERFFTNLNESVLEDLSFEVREKLNNLIEIIATEPSVPNVNNALKRFNEILNVIFAKSYYVSKSQIEKEMIYLAWKRNSSLPPEVAPDYGEPIFQFSVYDYQFEIKASWYYDQLMSGLERNGDYNFIDNVKAQLEILEEGSAIIETEEGFKIVKLPALTETLPEEFKTEGDVELQEELVNSIQEDIKRIILHIGDNEIMKKRGDYNYEPKLQDHEIQHRLNEQHRSRKKVENSEDKNNKTPEEVEKTDEWLIGARSREGRFQELIKYRQEVRQKIMKELEDIVRRLENVKEGSDLFKKLYTEYLYVNSTLMDVEKLFSGEYGYYLWRQQHHEAFLIDQIRNAWRERKDPKVSQELRDLTKKLRDTREYGYRYWEDESSNF
ncbi:MAG: hypothetical protein OHK0017_05230 [Patescibacteria group bacterium]